MQLSPAVALTTWLNAVIAGSIDLDRAVAAVTGGAPNCVVLTAERDSLPLGAAVRSWLWAGLDAVRLALPVPGDLLGLAGPPAFNRTALDVGEAVLLPALGTGLVCSVDARTLVWTSHPAARPGAPLDPRESDVMLRQALHEATDRLVQLDVAAWQPRIPDLLLEVRRHPPAPLPRSMAARWQTTFDRALLCLEIVALAGQDDGGAVSAHQMQERRSCLAELGRAARRALVAVCSDSLGPT